MCEQYPEPDEQTVPAAEGTAAHWVASTMLESWIATPSQEISLALGVDFIDKPAPNGVIVPEEMVEHALVYVKDVLKMAQQRGTLSNTFVERYVQIHSVHPENEGTLDSGVFMDDQEAKTFRLWDFKYGWGIVEPFGNWQLIDYCIGLLAEWEARGIGPPEVVEICIVQPRPYHPLGPIRVWRTTPAELFSYYQQLHASAHEALGPSPMCTPGAHCYATRCSARHACSALNAAVMQGLDFVDTAVPAELSGLALANEIKVLRLYESMFEARKSGIEERGLSQVKGGQMVPGFGAEAGKGRTKWKSEQKQAAVDMCSLMGVDIKKPLELITPKQAEAKGIDSAVISSYIETPTTGLKLVEVDTETANQIFSKV
jgi:hypothetical protein